MPLKALAERVLERNHRRNPGATRAENERNSAPSKMASELRPVHGVPLPELRHLAGDDWSEIEADPELLDAFASAVQARRLREQGQIPPDWTETVTCAGCGPVLLWSGAPERVEACPWCFNRVKGLPVPEAKTMS